MPIAEPTPTIATTVITSINVNPACRDEAVPCLGLNILIAGCQVSNWHADYFTRSKTLNSLSLSHFYDLLRGKIRWYQRKNRQIPSQRAHIFCRSIKLYAAMKKSNFPSFHRNGPDLLIGRLSTQNFLYPVLYQGRHPFFHCQAMHVSGPGSGLDEPLHLFRSF